VALAQARFGELSQAELRLLRAAPKGEMAWCGPNALDDDPANDPAKADEWGPGREIQADLLRWLCKDRGAASAVDPAGIQVHAARISGGLNLSFVSVPFPLGLVRCRLTDDANLISTDLPALNLAGSRVLSIDGDGANVRGNVFLNRGFDADGEVRFLGAQIGGDLDCGGGAFKNPRKNALSADHADIKGSIFLREGFSVEGEVRLLGTGIGCDLDCSGGTFGNPGRNALSADATSVKGNVFLREGFSAEGEVRLLGAQIGGSLECRGGTFKNPGNDALSMDGANGRGGVFLGDGFSADGEVRLLGAQIGGSFTCSRGTLKNPGGKALNAGRADVEGSVFFTDCFRAEGEVRLTNAEIGGDLACTGGKFSGVLLQRATIAGALFWRALEATETAELDLTKASVGSLADDEKSWPGKGKLFLDGLAYEHISGDSPRDAKTRLRWLERQDPFRPKPYRQLAKVLREAGDESSARRVLFEMECRRRQDEDRRSREEIGNQQPPLAHFPRLTAPITASFRVCLHLRRWGARLWGWLLKWTIGYGFHPGWAICGLLLLAALGWGLFRHGYYVGAMAPTDKDAYCHFHAKGWAPNHYQRFTASVYSLENSLPFVNLGQKDHWTPDPNPQASRWMSAILRWFRWGQVLAGWLLATLFVAGVTGVVRKE
jgi:hypothetical protein